MGHHVIVRGQFGAEPVCRDEVSLVEISHDADHFSKGLQVLAFLAGVVICPINNNWMNRPMDYLSEPLM